MQAFDLLQATDKKEIRPAIGEFSRALPVCIRPVNEVRQVMHRLREAKFVLAETLTVEVEEALTAYPRLVVLGDPGSGKTTLLRYLALIFARDLAEGGELMREKLGLGESGWLPVLLPLRQIGTFLRDRPDDGINGHALLLAFLRQALANERIALPDDFFDSWLTEGRTVLLLDGLDEVADVDLRRRVARLVESLTQAYPQGFSQSILPGLLGRV